jgi:anti-sigma B factor antagonist
MDLTLQRQLVDGVVVLAVHGEVDLATVPRLRDGLQRELSEAAGALVVDLDGVSLFDDIGLGVLLGARRTARARGGDLVIVASSARIRALFAETGAELVLPPFRSVAEAVEQVIQR